MTVDSLSRDSLTCDGQSLVVQLSPDMTTPTLMSSEPQPDLGRSAELPLVNSHVYKQDAGATSSTRAVSVGTVPSIVIPSTSTLVSSVSRARKSSVTGQQRPKSLDQEFTLLNLDIPNVTIHGVGFHVTWHWS